MKLLFLIRSLDIGGAEVQLVNLALAARKRGHDVHVAVFYGGGALEQRLQGAGVPLFDLKKQGRWDIAGFLIRLIRLLRVVRPALLYTSLEGANVVAALCKPFLGHTRLVWRIASSGLDISRLGWLSRMGYRLEDWLSALPDAVIVNSVSGRGWVERRGFPQQSLRVVPNGIDTLRFSKDLASGKAVREELGIPQELPVLAIAARIDPVKRHDLFFQAAAIVMQRVPDLRLICIGDGDRNLRESLAEQARVLGLEQKLVWTGFRQDTERLYNAMDLLCSSSDTEGFPNAVAEAMACGVPVVATDAGDSREIVGSCGRVVEAGDVKALAVAISDILIMSGGERKRLGDCSRKRVSENYSIDRMVDASLAVFTAQAG